MSGRAGRGSSPSCPTRSAKSILAGLPIRSRVSCPSPSPRSSRSSTGARGFVVSHGERFEGAAGAAAPVRDARGQVIGDVIVSWADNPALAQSEAEFARAAVEAAA